MEACAEAIDLHAQFADKGSSIALSDVGCGVICCKAALQAASLNVFINTKSMQDRRCADEFNAKAHALIDSYTTRADSIFEAVAARLDQ
jgi:formiminotetrahydrofolate cyclodeaminase